MPGQTVQKLPAHWKAAAIAAAICVILMSGINGALLDTGTGNIVEFAVGALFGMIAVLIFSAIAALTLHIASRTPGMAAAIIAGAVLALWYLRENSIPGLLRILLNPGEWKWPLPVPNSLSPLALSTIVLAAAALAGLWVFARSGRLQTAARAARISIVATTTVLLVLAVSTITDLAHEGSDPFPATYGISPNSNVQPATPDPSQAGSYEVEYLTYGAGENRRRPEFGAERDLESRTVDAAALLPEWKDLKEDMRERYWGFGLAEAPLNGLVWAPVGQGPFPIVLIVHGNHGMEDFSDTGYAYLGELLASRGFVTVSVDENFINGTWSGDFRGKEMPLRAWFLLEHLQLWQEWNDTPGHQFFKRIDMENIALLGHSRGGEAVSIAQAYNDLSHYPDDATVLFSYGFGIRSLVAIAQVDQRYHRRVKLENVNFFTLHGSYDSDEPAYHGMRQFNRIELHGDDYRVKAGIYIHGANHGQFNTGWGRADASPPGSWLLNLAPLIDGEDQRQVAKTYIAAFLEATLHDDQRYLSFLKDPRYGADWLPDLPLVNQFTDSTFVPIATFDEDLDVTTATAAGADISSNELGLWREEDIEHRDKRKQGTNVVVLGWNSDSGGNASYTINLDDSAADMSLTADTSLSFSVSGSTEEPPTIDADNAEDESEDDEPVSPTFSIEVADRVGNSASIVISELISLAPPMRVQYMKHSGLNEEWYESEWEAVLQHVELPLSVFAADNPALDLSSVARIQFRFDQEPEGVVILDDIGILPDISSTNIEEPFDD